MNSSAPDLQSYPRVTERWRSACRHRGRLSRLGRPATRPHRLRTLRFAALTLFATVTAPPALADRMPQRTDAAVGMLHGGIELVLPDRSEVVALIERSLAVSSRGEFLTAQESAVPPENRGTPVTPTQPVTEYLRWWLALALSGTGVMLLVLAWSIFRGRGARRARRRRTADPDPALEYFPDCSLIDLHGITGKPVHRLSSKYNMITRLQNPAVDSINYIQVLRRQISRRHALIEYRDFSFWITDQDSLNGTFVNDERIHDETRLKHGDRIRFHTYAFEFCVSDLVMSNETLVGGKLAGAQ